MLATSVVLSCITCSSNTGPTYSLAGQWQGSQFQLTDVRQIGSAVAGTFDIPFNGINTGGCDPNSTITAPMTGRVSGTLVRLQIDSFGTLCGEVPASTWTGHFRDASTVLGAWTVDDNTIPDSLVRLP